MKDTNMIRVDAQGPYGGYTVELNPAMVVSARWSHKWHSYYQVTMAGGKSYWLNTVDYLALTERTPYKRPDYDAYHLNEEIPF